MRRRRDIGRTLTVRLVCLTLALLVGAAVVLSWGALQSFERALLPELERKAVTIGAVVTGAVGRALGLGVPFAEMRGVDAFLQDLLDAHGELAFLALTDAGDEVRFTRGRTPDEIAALLAAPGVGDVVLTSLPITAEDALVGRVQVAVDKAYVDRTILETVYDIGTVLLVAVLVTFEAVLIMTATGVGLPMRVAGQLLARLGHGDFRGKAGSGGSGEVGRVLARIDARVDQLCSRYARLCAKVAAVERSQSARERLKGIAEAFRLPLTGRAEPVRESNLVAARTPLFVFMFAEELSRAFFPLYVEEFASPFPMLSKEVVLGLPLALFMLVVALFTPISGRLTDRLGARRTMVLGIVPAIFGFVGTSLAQDMASLLAWRALTAVSYAMVFIASQSFIAAHTDERNRASGMALFIGGVIAAGICGMAIGGVLADQIGYRPTFMLSAGLSALAALAALIYLPADRPAPVERTSQGGALRLMGNFRLWALLLLAAIPGKLMLTGSLFYLTPLLLDQQGIGASSIGRVMMAYGLVIIFVSPLAARLADRLGRPGLFVALGSLLAGAGPALMLWQVDLWTVLAGVVALGLGHALTGAAQLAMLPALCAREIEQVGRSTVLAFYRLMERGGAVLGPMLAGALAAQGGYGDAMGMLGAGMMVAGLLFSLVFISVPCSSAQPPALAEAAA